MISGRALHRGKGVDDDGKVLLCRKTPDVQGHRLVGPDSPVQAESWVSPPGMEELGVDAAPDNPQVQITARGQIIALLAVPILIQVFFNSALAYWLNRAVGEKHSVACPSALIGASNFFELAVAAAISLFGFESGAALATVVGVLIEVPVMLLVVRAVNASRGWYERRWRGARRSPSHCCNTLPLPWATSNPIGVITTGEKAWK